MNETIKTATFAGGCFWCMEPPFDELDGVISTVSGYTGGQTVAPTYEEVSSGITGHAESMQVTYDPSRIGYEKLLDVFWHNIDPLARDRQFCDIGGQYRSAIFYHDDEQKQLAEASKRALEQSGRFEQPIATQIVTAERFYPAEEYHQDYYKKNPIRYKFYRFSCGRDRRLKDLWGEGRFSPMAGTMSLLALVFTAIGLASATVHAQELEQVTTVFEREIPNLPGKSLVAQVVAYGPGGRSQSHLHAASAFIYAHVLSGAIRSQVDDAPAKVYRVGEGFYEEPGSHHRVSENASDREPASLLAVIVVDSKERQLVLPDRKQESSR